MHRCEVLTFCVNPCSCPFSLQPNASFPRMPTCLSFTSRLAQRRHNGGRDVHVSDDIIPMGAGSVTIGAAGHEQTVSFSQSTILFDLFTGMFFVIHLKAHQSRLKTH